MKQCKHEKAVTNETMCKAQLVKLGFFVVVVVLFLFFSREQREKQGKESIKKEHTIYCSVYSNIVPY